MGGERTPSDDLIDQSKLRLKRAARRVDESLERIERTEHRWLGLAVGRVCRECREAQATGEFEDSECSRAAG